MTRPTAATIRLHGQRQDDVHASFFSFFSFASFFYFFSGSQQNEKRDSHYLLRPEAVESFFVLHHITGDPIYREWGWEIFLAIERFCKLPTAYGSYKNVLDPNVKLDDRMESFFLAETLKYLFLLFDPDSDLDIINKHVFNTLLMKLTFFFK